MKKRLLLILFITLINTSVSSSTKTQIRIFNASDYQVLLNSQKNNAFTLIFWSLNCTPCLHDLKTIGKQQPEKRKNYVFIATDGHDVRQAITKTLKNFNLEDANHWVLNSDEIEEIRLAIDTSWYGETPRIYQFDKNHKRTRITN